uniref:Prss2 protein n=1 Tax=Fopius arisanus TaxID=64838 RepID=A0A0C9RFB1_9HYME
MSSLGLFLGIFQLCYLTSSSSRSLDPPSLETPADRLLGERRIVGGFATDIKSFPSIVSIRKRSYDHHHCGGSYISERFVLTAAHCLVSKKDHYWTVDIPWMFTVVAGSTTLGYSPTWQISDVDNLIPHPFFSFQSMAHDIGLIRTSTAFIINQFVAYARLPVEVNNDMFNYSGTCTVAGWGKTTATGQGSSGILRSASIPLIDDQQCGVYYAHKLHPGQICAGREEGGIDACQGDSGGPLICNETQVGLVSWGHGCAVARSPGVYCRVDFYFDWINETMIRNSSSSYNHSELFSILLAVMIIYIN